MEPEVSERTAWYRHRLVFTAAVVGLLMLVGVGLKRVWLRFANMALVAKSAEGMGMLEQIHEAEIRYFEQHGEYVAVGPTPQRVPGRAQTSFESEHMAEWERLGWHPGSKVRCQYEVTVPTPTNFRAWARCDVDGDGQQSVFVSSRDHPPKRVSPDDRY